MTRLIIAFSYMGTSLRFAFTWEQPHRAKFRTVRLNVAFNYDGGGKKKKKRLTVIQGLVVVFSLRGYKPVYGVSWQRG